MERKKKEPLVQILFSQICPFSKFHIIRPNSAYFSEIEMARYAAHSGRQVIYLIRKSDGMLFNPVKRLTVLRRPRGKLPIPDPLKSLWEGGRLKKGNRLIYIILFFVPILPQVYVLFSDCAEIASVWTPAPTMLIN